MDAAVSTADLLNAAEGLASDVSERKLRRWRDDGLLPEGRRIGRGRGAGADWRFPKESVTQLQTLLRLRGEGVRHHRDLRIRLWLEGHPIAIERVRTGLLGSLPQMSLPNDETEHEDALDQLAGRAAERFDGRVVRSQADREAVAHHFIALAAGMDAHEFLEAPVDYDPDEGITGLTIEELMERAIGVHGASWIDDTSGTGLSEVARLGLLDFSQYRRSLQCAGLAELEQARRDRFTLHRLTSLPGAEQAFGRLAWATLAPFLRLDSMAIASSIAVCLRAREADRGIGLDVLSETLSILTECPRGEHQP